MLNVHALSHRFDYHLLKLNQLLFFAAKTGLKNKRFMQCQADVNTAAFCSTEHSSYLNFTEQNHHSTEHIMQ